MSNTPRPRPKKKLLHWHAFVAATLKPAADPDAMPTMLYWPLTLPCDGTVCSAPREGDLETVRHLDDESAAMAASRAVGEILALSKRPAPRPLVDLVRG